MTNTATPIPTTCTIVTGADGSRCGKPAVITFTSSRGHVFGECDDHAVITAETVAEADARVIVTERTPGGVVRVWVDGTRITTTRTTRFIAIDGELIVGGANDLARLCRRFPHRRIVLVDLVARREVEA